jgi:phosphate starvation-inducible membrane PsiE
VSLDAAASRRLTHRLSVADTCLVVTMKLLVFFGRLIGEPADNPWRYRISTFVLAMGFTTLLLHYFGSRNHGPESWIASAGLGSVLGLVTVAISEAVVRRQSADNE